MPTPSEHKTWIEISTSAAAANVRALDAILSPGVKRFAVVKSNAYGHGIVAMSRILDTLGVDGFCVDSAIEALKLRAEVTQKPILVLGPTLPALAAQAAQASITLSISNLAALQALVAALPDPATRPAVHIKFDSGMHRQGFQIQNLEEGLQFCRANGIRVVGIFSHFASAKDINYPTFSQRQYQLFTEAVQKAEALGFTGLVKHIAATGGTLVDPTYHLDQVRIGIGYYGLYPSRELEIQLGDKLRLKPVLSWRAVVSEVKTIAAGEYVGYDLTERVNRETTLAIIPIGYWHGLPWALSGKGEVLIRGRRAKILGRVSMDMVTVDVTGGECRPGDTATLIGTDGTDTITAREVAAHFGGSPYEVITRLNPLIERVVTD
jgi:alanine racemase